MVKTLPDSLFLGPGRVVGEALKWVEAGVSRDGWEGVMMVDPNMP